MSVPSFLFSLLAGSGRDAHDCLDVLTAGRVWFQLSVRFSITIQMYRRNFARGKPLKLNGFFVGLQCGLWVDQVDAFVRGMCGLAGLRGVGLACRRARGRAIGRVDGQVDMRTCERASERVGGGKQAAMRT